jgi:hypothetical protein
MNYGILEKELVARLDAYFKDNIIDHLFEAIPIPQNQAEQERPFIKSKTTIQYYKSKYSTTKSTNIVVQSEEILIRITFECRTLREENGFYNLIEHVKKSLLGYKPDNCTKRLTISDYDLEFYENNTVSPFLELSTETENVQAFDDEEPGPQFKKAQVNDCT